MYPLPVEILLGVYLGILTGILPGLAAWAMGFVFKYFTGVSIPGFAVVVTALALAGVNGGLLALADETVQRNASAPVIVTAIVVVTMISLYAHSKGDQMGSTFPRRLSLQGLRERTLSADVVELVGGGGEVRLAVDGEVADMEGYPPLSADLRDEIRAGDWRLPADLPIGELESRFADRLRTEFDLAEVSVAIDEQGRATVAAAPPLSGLSKRVPADRRAVSVDALIPTGMARGDEVRIVTPETTVAGPVLSARSGEKRPPERSVAVDGGSELESEPAPDAESVVRLPSPTTAGGDGRVTVAVPHNEADALLRSESARVVVTARGVRREYELVSMLRRAGKQFRTLTLGAGSSLVGQTLAEASLRERRGVAVLAVKRSDEWTIAPDGDEELRDGDELFAVGAHDALDGFAEVAG